MNQSSIEPKPGLLLLIPNLGLGGAQRVFADHARFLAATYRVTECVFNLEQADNHQTNNELVSLQVLGGGGAVAKLRHFVARCVGLRQLKQKRNITLAISHLEGADYVNVLSGAGERRVLCVHGSKLHDRNMRGAAGWLRRRVLIPLLYRRADRVVTVSTGIQAELVNVLGLPAHKVQVINNFFDDVAIRAQAAAPVSVALAAVLAQHPVLATAGRFAPEKNLLALLNVFALVRQQMPQARLLLVGQGEQYPALLACCERLGLPVCRPEELAESAPAVATASVLFAGFQANPHAFVARATVFVLPSLNEGFPMALGEAMVCGRPVAAADCPTGPREMLAPGTPDPPAAPLRQVEAAAHGLLLPVLSNPDTQLADEQVWAEALVGLLANEAERERLGRRAAERMQAFTPARIARQWLDLLAAVRAGK